ncbi:hypothetical protein [Streptomyces sp. C]|uniref:hypothetical protein n=1 Tax=Streptomyces sp. C TaxID=253839 RepID=UPI0001B581A5|nr:hypothetical protein [Streptomyces sp. C]
MLLLVAAVLAALAAKHVWLRDEKVRARLVGTAVLGYGGLVAVVTWQAWRGQSPAHPDAATLLALAAVLLLPAAAGTAVAVSARRRTTPVVPTAALAA